MPLQDSRFARCGRDSCVADIWKHGRRLRLLATRSSVFIDRRRLEPACADADIVVSDRRLTYWCAPRCLKADRTLLQRTGGLAIDTSNGVARSVTEANGPTSWAHRTNGCPPPGSEAGPGGKGGCRN